MAHSNILSCQSEKQHCTLSWAEVYVNRVGSFAIIVVEPHTDGFAHRKNHCTWRCIKTYNTKVNAEQTKRRPVTDVSGRPGVLARADRPLGRTRTRSQCG